MKQTTLFCDIKDMFLQELRRIFHDGGVVLLFCVASLLYPLIFGVVYRNEVVQNLPIAVVDDSRSTESRRFAHKLDATPEMNVDYRCCTMAEAERLVRQRKAYGIVYFPSDYGSRLADGRTARACLFCDMSSFLYYRSLFSGTTAVLVDELKQVESDRYARAGIVGEEVEQLTSPVPYNDVKLYLPGGGFASFLVPALLVLVIHQTLFLGVGILSGSARERGETLRDVPVRLRSRWGIHRVTVGRAAAYFVVYLPITAVLLIGLPHLFGLPHLARLGDLALFVVPFLAASIFFSMTVGNFVRGRDTGILVCIFFSVILLFLSGAVWPQCSMPALWRWFSYLFPSTHGIQGFIRINSMGAGLSSVAFEVKMLWALAGFYFLTACGSLRLIRFLRGGRRFKELV